MAGGNPPCVWLLVSACCWDRYLIPCPLLLQEKGDLNNRGHPCDPGGAAALHPLLYRRYSVPVFFCRRRPIWNNTLRPRSLHKMPPRRVGARMWTGKALAGPPASFRGRTASAGILRVRQCQLIWKVQGTVVPCRKVREDTSRVRFFHPPLLPEAGDRGGEGVLLLPNKNAHPNKGRAIARGATLVPRPCRGNSFRRILPGRICPRPG